MNIGKRNILLVIAGVFVIVFVIASGTMAFWGWESEKLYFNMATPGGFYCSVDGGGEVDTASTVIMPTDCNNSSHAIVREINTEVAIYDTDLDVYMDFWLIIDSIASELNNTTNFKYALTTDGTSCTNGVIAAGSIGADIVNVTGASGTEKRISLFDDKIYRLSSDQDTVIFEDKYYLYIWLDKAETNMNTSGKSFMVSLGGECVSDNTVS